MANPFLSVTCNLAVVPLTGLGSQFARTAERVRSGGQIGARTRYKHLPERKHKFPQPAVQPRPADWRSPGRLCRRRVSERDETLRSVAAFATVLVISGR